MLVQMNIFAWDIWSRVCLRSHWQCCSAFQFWQFPFQWPDIMKLVSWNSDVGKSNFGVEKSKHLLVCFSSRDSQISCTVFSTIRWVGCIEFEILVSEANRVTGYLDMPFACQKPDSEQKFFYLLRNHNPTLCIPSINFLQLPVWMDDNPVFCLWTTLYYLFQIFFDFFHSTLEFLEYLSFLHWIYSTVCCSSWSLPFISMMSLMLSERSRRQGDHSLCGAMPKLIVEYKPWRLSSINVVVPMMGFFCAL